LLGTRAETAGLLPGGGLTTADGKNAGRITSLTFSPSLSAIIALAYVRYDFLAPETKLHAGEVTAVVKSLPFVI
jgi:glycine cleavage system aminomethyltransferase T